MKIQKIFLDPKQTVLKLRMSQLTCGSCMIDSFMIIREMVEKNEYLINRLGTFH